MTWQEVPVIGHPTRKAIELASRTRGAHVELELASDAVPPHSYQPLDTWFLNLSITGFDTTADTHHVDTVDEPMTSISFTGTIADTDIPVQVMFFGEVLDRFMIDLDL